MNVAILEAESGSRDEVPHRAGDEHLIGCRQRGHPRPDVNGDASKLLSDRLALAGMQPGTYLDSERANGVPDGARAADGPCGAIERRQEPVAGRVNLPSPEALDLSPHPGVEALEELAPAPIAEGGRALRRAHDVHEEHGRQHAVRLGRVARADEELLDLPEHGLGVAEPGQMVLAGELNVACGGNVPTEVTPLLDTNEPVAGWWMTRAGTVMADRMARTSISAAIRKRSIAAAGLAAERWKRAQYSRAMSFLTRPGSRPLMSTPSPQPSSTRRRTISRTSDGTPSG